MAKQRDKCFLISFDDGTTIRLHARNEEECLYCATNPSAIIRIGVQSEMNCKEQSRKDSI